MNEYSGRCSTGSVLCTQNLNHCVFKGLLQRIVVFLKKKTSPNFNYRYKKCTRWGFVRHRKLVPGIKVFFLRFRDPYHTMIMTWWILENSKGSVFVFHFSTYLGPTKHNFYRYNVDFGLQEGRERVGGSDVLLWWVVLTPTLIQVSCLPLSLSLHNEHKKQRWFGVFQSLTQPSVCATCRSLIFNSYVFHHTDTHIQVFYLGLPLSLHNKQQRCLSVVHWYIIGTWSHRSIVQPVELIVVDGTRFWVTTDSQLRQKHSGHVVRQWFGSIIIQWYHVINSLQ